MKHIVFYSGGIGSWYAAKRVVERHGAENVVLLFTDTLVEDEDLYRFLDESTALLGATLVKIADGRTPWEVFRDERFIGNSRIAPCSHILKQETAEKWIKANYAPDECVLYLGIDWTEEHRTVAPRKNWLPYRVEFPMCDEPYVMKDDMIAELASLGVTPPRLYALGFSHNNCGGFCVRAGQGHFANLLDKLPERYKAHEAQEESLRQYLGKDVSILRRQRQGVKTPLTLRQLRDELQGGDASQVDMFDIGGCGCFVNYDEEASNA
jgi:hypothetical protein